MMEDSLQYLVHGSLTSFVTFNRALCDWDVTVHSTDRVDSTPRPAALRKGPLLTLDLEIDPSTGKIRLSEDPRLIPGQMAALLDQGIAATTGLNQLEPLLMSKLYWAYKPKLQSVHPMEVRPSGSFIV